MCNTKYDIFLFLLLNLLVWTRTKYKICICAGQLMTCCFQLIVCVDLGSVGVKHFYFDGECYDGTWWVSFIILVTYTFYTMHKKGKEKRIVSERK